MANRAFLDTDLYKAATAKGWLFSGINATQFLGPALNLSIPAAYNYFFTKAVVFSENWSEGV